MKWIKVAIGAVIAVLSIGIIATTVFKMTQPREVIREVSVEIDPVEGKYYPTSAFNKILEYGVIGEEDKVINIVSAYIDDKVIDMEFFYVTTDLDIIEFNGFVPGLEETILIDSYIEANGDWFGDRSDLNYNAIIKLVFEVTQPPQLTGINATLILLIPLVFVGGLLLYFYKPLKKD